MVHPSPSWCSTSIHTLGHGPKPSVFLAAAAVSGHAIAHLVAILSPATQPALLADTGHLHLLVAAVVALVASLYVAGSMAVRNAGAGAGGRALRTDLCPWLALRLAAAQLLLLLAWEAIEPVAGGVPLAGVLHRGLLLWGFLAQLLVALLATLLLGWLARAAALVDGLLARPLRLAPAVRRLPRLVVDVVIADAMIPGSLPARGPPS